MLLSADCVPLLSSYGSGSDNFVSFKVATYNWTIDTVSALRGGGGGNFGYVLEMTLEIHRIAQTNLPS